MIYKVITRRSKYKVVSRNAPTLDSLIISILLTRLRLQAETAH
jgi:hypothetical protein